jgi:hypothetical protein
MAAELVCALLRPLEEVTMSEHETPISRRPNDARDGEPIEDEHEPVGGNDRDQELEREGAAPSDDGGSGEVVRSQSSPDVAGSRRNDIDEP